MQLRFWVRFSGFGFWSELFGGCLGSRILGLELRAIHIAFGPTASGFSSSRGMLGLGVDGFISSDGYWCMVSLEG